MNKTITLFLIGLCLWNCTDSVETESLTKEIISLKKENDSLKEIINEINQKYVFDSIGVRTIPSHSNTGKLNSIDRNEIVFIGYNTNGNSRVMFNEDDKLNLKYTDTLRMEKGAFIFERKLTEEYNYFNGKVETENKYGKIYGTMISIGVLAK